VEEAVVNTNCRRCSECPDAKHHWLPECPPGEEPYWGCKHCDYRCESVSCEACGEEVPIDTWGWARLCDNCIRRLKLGLPAEIWLAFESIASLRKAGH
jgi:hypothetical protein